MFYVQISVIVFRKKPAIKTTISNWKSIVSTETLRDYEEIDDEHEVSGDTPFW